MLKKIFILSLAAVILVSSIMMPSSDATGTSHSEYTAADGSAYQYETYGSGSETSPYESGIFGFTMGDSENVRIQSALEGYPVTRIAEGSFKGTEMKSVLIPERIHSIGNNAFADCKKLTDAYFLGDLPASIAEDAFSENVIFHYLDGKEGWPSYDRQTKEAIEISETESPDGSVSKCILIGSEAIVIDGTPNDNGDMTIPDKVLFSESSYSVVSLGAWIFYDRSDIVNVKIQQGVKEISERAFYKCDTLVMADIPDTVVTIADEAFRECHNLNNVVMQNVRFIGFEAFRMCYVITSITVPDSAVFIGEGAFRYCTAMTTITLSPNISEMAPWVLDGCYLLESIDIPDNVTSIGDHAFHLCRSLEEITIPNSVGAIGDYAFSGCSSLKNVHFEGDVPELGKDAFKGTSAGLNIHYSDDPDNTMIVVVLILIIPISIAIALYFLRSKRIGFSRDKK